MNHEGLPLQIIGDIVIEHDNNQMEVNDGNLTIDHVQKPRQMIEVRLNKAPKTSAERGREFRARKALLKQQEPDAIVEIATDDIQGTGPSENNQVPEPSEITTIERRAKSEEATRRWREKKGVSESSKKQAKTARNDTSIISLQDEFRRLSLNTLSTIGRTILDFMNDRKKLSMVTFNCQSLRKHVSDLSDPAIDSSNILFLSETWSNDDENIDIPNFDCIAKFKRQNVRSAGVAIYQKSNDTSNIVTSNVDILLRHIREVDIGQSSIGDICAAHCVLDDGTNIIMVVVYISPNNTVNNIIKFIYRRLMIYGRVGSEELGENYHTLPLILAGDFNINFASEDGQLLINFLQDKLELQMNNDRNEPTTRHGTTIDAVFSRFLSNFNSKIYVSYFSYHKPIVSVLQSTTVITDVPNNENNE